MTTIAEELAGYDRERQTAATQQLRVAMGWAFSANTEPERASKDPEKSPRINGFAHAPATDVPSFPLTEALIRRLDEAVAAASSSHAAEADVAVAVLLQMYADPDLDDDLRAKALATIKAVRPALAAALPTSSAFGDALRP